MIKPLDIINDNKHNRKTFWVYHVGLLVSLLMVSKTMFFSETFGCCYLEFPLVHFEVTATLVKRLTMLLLCKERERECERRHEGVKEHVPKKASTSTFHISFTGLDLYSCPWWTVRSLILSLSLFTQILHHWVVNIFPTLYYEYNMAIVKGQSIKIICPAFTERLTYWLEGVRILRAILWFGKSQDRKGRSV